MDIRFQSVIPNVQLEKEVGLLHFLQGRDGVLGDRDELRGRLREDRLLELENWKIRPRKFLHFCCKNLQIFGGLVLGCIKTNFCKKIRV